MRNKILFFALLVISTSCSSRMYFFDDRDKNDKIFDVAEKGDLKSVNKLLAEGSDINSALRGAVKGNHDDLIDDLVVRGADVSDAIIEAELHKYSLEKKNDNNHNEQIAFYKKTIRRLLIVKKPYYINYQNILVHAIVLRDHELIKEIFNHYDPAFHGVVINVVNHKDDDTIRLILEHGKYDFCNAVSFANENDGLGGLKKKQSIEYKKFCAGYLGHRIGGGNK